MQNQLKKVSYNMFIMFHILKKYIFVYDKCHSIHFNAIGYNSFNTLLLSRKKYCTLIKKKL